VHLDERPHAPTAGFAEERLQAFAIERRDDQEHSIGIERARLDYLVLVDDEVLAQDRQRGRRPRLAKVLGPAAEARLLAEDRER
jgi:hypothetical protein